MSSFKITVGKVLCLSLFGFLLYFAPSAQADDNDDMVLTVENQLTQATTASGSERENLLNEAMKNLKHIPGETSKRNKGTVKSAASYISSALFEIKKGDPDNKVIDFIHDALEVVRKLER